ncbi:MAG: DegQ family serine endoprotease [Candidatus Sumerlaeia bacterium]
MFCTTRSIRAIAAGILILVAASGFGPAGARAAGSNTSEVSREAVAQLQSLSDAFAEVSAKVKPAVVNVRTTREIAMPSFGPWGEDPFEEFRRFFGPDFDERFQLPQRPDRRQPNKQRISGIGSGVIVSPDGKILTNNHVIDGADEIIVTLSDRKEYTAELKGSDPKTDLAVLQIKADTPLPYLELGDSDKLRVGDWVIAVGNPLGFTNTVTVGIVSATGRANVGLAEFEDFIQTDAAINQGNSGGPLVNIQGEVVGINSAIATRTGGFSGIGLAIPSNMARSVMTQLLEKGRVSRGWLGIYIQDLTSDLARQFGTSDLNGALIGKVMPDTPAEKAGLKTGDIVRKLDGEPVRDASDLKNRVAALAPDSMIQLEIERGGKTKTIKMKIGERPDDENVTGGRSGSAQDQQINLGFEVEDLTEELARRFDYDPKKDHGVVVVRVESGSDAAMKGLRPGQLIEEVNQKPVNNVEEFRKAIEEHDDEAHMLLVRSGDVSQFIVVRARK